MINLLNSLSTSKRKGLPGCIEKLSAQETFVDIIKRIMPVLKYLYEHQYLGTLRDRTYFLFTRSTRSFFSVRFSRRASKEKVRFVSQGRQVSWALILSYDTLPFLGLNVTIRWLK